MEDNDAPGAGPVWTPGTWLAGFIKRTTIHCYIQNIKALGLVVSKNIFLIFFPLGANDPIFDPRGMIGRIYVNVHITMLNTKYRS